ncbi:MAG: TAXI family TRAP transporter solute-binding subunit [Lautropia sp.]
MRFFKLALSLALLTGAVATIHAQQRFVKIGAGVTGTYALFGAKLAEVINSTYPDLRASAISGPTEQNMVRVQRGELDFVLSYTFQSALTHSGKGELGVATPDLRQVMSTYGSFYFPLARPGLGIATPADLVKRPFRVWMGPKSGAFYAINTAYLASYGVTPDAIAKAGGVISTIGYQNLEQAFRDGQVDFAFFAGPVPYSMLMQLDRAGFEMIGMSDEAAAKFVSLLPGMSVETHPAGVYTSVPKALRVPYLFNQVSTNAKVPDEIVYRVVKTTIEQNKVFHPLFPGATEIGLENALRSNLLPMHPGAERYFREVGLIK